MNSSTCCFESKPHLFQQSTERPLEPSLIARHMPWLLFSGSQYVFEDEKPIYYSYPFWLAAFILLMPLLLCFNLRFARAHGPGMREVPAAWRPGWTASMTRHPISRHRVETSDHQAGNKDKHLNETEQARYIRHQTEFDPPPARNPSPPRRTEPSRLLKNYRNYYDHDFPRQSKRFGQGIWLFNRRSDSHECSNPHLFVSMEDSTHQEKKQSNIWGRGTVILYLSDNVHKTSCSPLQLQNVSYIRNSHFTNHHTFSLTAISDTVKICDYGTAWKRHTNHIKQLIETSTGQWLGEVEKDWVYKNEKGWIVQTCPYNAEHGKTVDPILCPNHGWWPRMIRWYDNTISRIYG